MRRNWEKLRSDGLREERLNWGRLGELVSTNVELGSFFWNLNRMKMSNDVKTPNPPTQRNADPYPNRPHLIPHFTLTCGCTHLHESITQTPTLKFVVWMSNVCHNRETKSIFKLCHLTSGRTHVCHTIVLTNIVVKCTTHMRNIASLHTCPLTRAT